jgi:hypothetical protein
MSDDRFLERLRADAARLRFEPKDDFVWTRLRARVRGRLQQPANVSQMLARWVRPMTASFAILTLGAALSVAWVDRAHESAYVAEAMTSNPVEITVDGDTFNFAE